MDLRLARWWKGEAFIPGKCLKSPTEGTNWRAQQLPPAPASGSGESCGARGEVNEPCGTGPPQEANPTVLTLPHPQSALQGRFAWTHHPSQMANRRQSSLWHATVTSCSPHPGQPCAREVPARCCCAWEMRLSEAGTEVCSHTQLHSELFNCTDITEAQTAMTVFFLK